MNPLDSGRRDLFRSTLGKWVESMMESAERRVVTRRYSRPPGAMPEMAFLAACTRCGLCVDPCPPKAIRLATSEGGLAAGTPFIDAASQPCTVCPDMPCVKACPTGALTFPPGGWTGYRLAALELVAERCVTFHGRTCSVCASSCPVGAAALVMDDDGHPVIHQEGCVGCGVCVRACITSPSSFTLTPLEA